MKYLSHLGLASVFVILMNFAPAPAFASKNIGMAHVRTQTYHDRTPTAHTHGSHPHHG